MRRPRCPRLETAAGAVSPGDTPVRLEDVSFSYPVSPRPRARRDRPRALAGRDGGPRGRERHREESTLAALPLRLVRSRARAGSWSAGPSSRSCEPRSGVAIWRGSRSSRRSFGHRSRTTSGSASAVRAATHGVAQRRGVAGQTPSSRRSRTATRPSSATVGVPSRPASAGELRSRGPSFATRRSSSSTSPPQTSIRTARR